MKFSFEGSAYRKNLADKLKDERAVDKEGAKKILEDERKTLKYMVAEDVRRMQVRLEQKGVAQNEPEEPTPEVITVERFKMTGSDGVERELEVETRDISSGIPDFLKLEFDITRLKKIDIELADLEIESSRDWTKQRVGIHNPMFKDLTEFEMFLEDCGLDPHELSPDVKDYLVAKHVLHPKDFWDYNIERAEGGQDYYEHEFRKEMHAAIDKLVQGAYSSQYVLSHAVYPRDGGFIHNRKQNAAEVKKRHPHLDSDSRISEKVFDVKKATSNHLWFSSGYEFKRMRNFYAHAENIILLCDTRNQRFRNEVKNRNALHSQERYEKILNEIQSDKEQITEDDEYEAFVKTASESLQGGVIIDFKKEEPWIFIADWIVDLYHGRLYKITEVGNSTSVHAGETE